MVDVRQIDMCFVSVAWVTPLAATIFVVYICCFCHNIPFGDGMFGLIFESLVILELVACS